MLSKAATIRRKRLNRPSKTIFLTRHAVGVALVAAFFLSYFLFMGTSLHELHHAANLGSGVDSPPALPHSLQGNKRQKLSEAAEKPQCAFREYPPHRYYKLHAPERPSFLYGDDVEYIYGELPMMLKVQNGGLPQSHGKLCINQHDSWLDPKDKELNRQPFADGTNPSIVRLDRIPQEHSIHEHIREKLNKEHIGNESSPKYIATLCLTNSQCSWNDTEQDKEKYRISTRDKPVTVRTILLILDANFRTMEETTILLERDAQWGNRIKEARDAYGRYKREEKAFDDARLFLHGGNIWISYREGRVFGWDKQVLNEIHMEWGASFTAKVKASESTTLCCGRNMALMEEASSPHSSEAAQLQALTWVDPVTVEDVDDGRTAATSRRLGENSDSSKKKSDFHGTNAFMVEWSATEWLGMGHFHRPPGRGQNEYARLGHHYTHAFFTVSRHPPYRLLRLSPEFVLPAKTLPSDAEIIQFASGLEVDDDQVVLAYGMNDCEGAIARVDRTEVEGLLRTVREGEEVVDLMSKRGTS